MNVFDIISLKLYVNESNCFLSLHADLRGTLSGHGSWVLSVDCSPNNKNFVSWYVDIYFF